MKKTLQQRLKAYSAVAGSVTAAAVSGHAQIIYTDVNPDFIVHDTVQYNLDMNADAVTDFTLMTGVGSYNSIPIPYAYMNIPAAQSNNAILGSVSTYQTYTYPIPFALNAGDTIQASDTIWNAQNVNNGYNTLGSVYGSSTGGNWLGQNDKYVGVRFDISGQTHYGWVRLYVSPGADTIIVKDFAYEQQPDSSIIAGAMPTGIHEINPLAAARVHSYGNTVFVHIPGNLPKGEIAIYNNMGQLVREEEISGTDMRIPLDGASTGVYFVQLKTEEAVISRKVFIR